MKKHKHEWRLSFGPVWVCSCGAIKKITKAEYAKINSKE